VAAPQTVAPARPTAPRQPDESSRRSRVQAARPNGPAAPLADWAQRQAQAAGPRVALGPAQPAAGVVELKGNGTFAPPAPVAEQLGVQRRAAPVSVRFGTLAAGSILVRRSKDRYDTPDEQAIPLVHPALDPLVAVGVLPVLAVAVRKSTVTGYVTIGRGKRMLPAGSDAIFDVIRKQPTALGWVGLSDLRLPNTINKLEAGVLTLQTNLQFGLGGFLKGTGRFGVIDETVAFNAQANASVSGLAKVDLDITRRPDGTLAGKVDVPVSFKNFSGRVVAMYADGVVDVTGKARYSTQKLSGEVTLQVTDAATAREVGKRLLPPSALQAEAAQAAGTAGARTPAPAGPRKGARAVIGWGTLNAHFSEWLTGTATVIIDSDGDVTVVGRIAPPAVVPLFKRDVRRRFLDVNPKFGFGVPYVARAYIGAEIWLGVIASLDAKLQQIEITGVYSTKPEVFNEFSIAATLLVIAMAGLEGGVGVEGGIELLGHDVSVGAGIKLTAGIVGKLEARPTLGYRELADPKIGRRGEFSLAGYVEIAAQPFLGLAGTAWIELDSPWWSPAPDKRWPKDLFSKEYMLGGPFGFGADFTYVLGSGKYPEFKPREPTLDGRALMSDLMDDNVPSGSRSKGTVPAKWTGKTPPAPPAPGPAPPAKPPKGRAEQKQTPKPEHQKRWHEGMREVGALTLEARQRPLGQAEIERRLGAIRARYGFTRLEAKAAGANWEIFAALDGTTNEQRPAKARRAPEPGAAATEAPSATPASGPVRTAVRAELTGKSVANAEQGGRLLADVFRRLQPRGLKGLGLRFNRQRPQSYDVLVNASVVDVALQITRQRDLAALARRFSPYTSRTSLYVFWDDDRKPFPANPIYNEDRHAETRFFLGREGMFEQLLALIDAARQSGLLRAAIPRRVPVLLQLNRLPCDGCAAVIRNIAGAHPELAIRVEASSILQANWQAAHQTSVKAAMDLMDAGVELAPLGIWGAVVQQMQQLGVQEVQVAPRARFWRPSEFGPLYAAEAEVQELIDAAIAAARRRGRVPDRGNV
jgi:hypothetical protein